MYRNFILVVAAMFILLTYYTPFTLYESGSICAFVFFLLSFINNVGNRLAILDVIILSSIFLCLVMPISGYHYFNSTNQLARLWVFHMRVPSHQYYSYMFPAAMMMIIGMKLPGIYSRQIYTNHLQYMIRVKQYLADKKWQGLILVTVGIVASLVQNLVPAFLSTPLSLLKYVMFVGVFYCLYSDMPRKNLILVGVFGMLIVRSVSQGMFGEFVFISMLSAILMMLGSKMRFSLKLFYVILGILSITILQSVKPLFREQLLDPRNKQNKLSLFASVLSKKISQPFSIYKNEKEMFVFYIRFNEGQIVSRVLNSVPERYPYANGETIYLSLAATVVPRFLWPDKPEAGGAANFMRFLGIKLKGYTIGLSPFGEAYGNFGARGGIIFMFFFGLLFNFAFHWLLKLTVALPSLILWFPFLFFYAVQIESDVVTMINSLTKFAFVAWILYKGFPLVFKRKL